ncbi:hypothetical protein C4D60_Mb10t27110 [Musa balbisiana]|uniref:Uncharacterized protein n=1 Tax=Musa balbisiana TaxID=52838 RepID=A0A4V4H548_MUSBA|nr:hypothetical protein C4D60_Mb10t27110 [Musa balbisiana]
MIEFMSPEADVHGLGAAGLYAAAMGTEAKDRAAHGARAAAEYTTEKGQASAVKDTTVEKSRQGLEVAKDDAAVSAGESAMDYAEQAASKAKDVAVSTGETAMEYTEEKTEETAKGMGTKAMDAAKAAGERTTGNTSEKAEGGKNTASAMARRATEKAQEARETAKYTGEEAITRAMQKAEEAIEAAKRALQARESKRGAS